MCESGFLSSTLITTIYSSKYYPPQPKYTFKPFVSRVNLHFQGGAPSSSRERPKSLRECQIFYFNHDEDIFFKNSIN